MFPWFALAHAATLPAAGSAGDLAIHARLAAHAADGGSDGCLTTTVMELREHWDHLPASERASLTAQIAPFKNDLFDPIPQRNAAPPPPATDTCWGQQGDNRVLTEHFSVEWDSGITESTARRFGEALELGYQVEVEELGWDPFVGDGQYLLFAWVENERMGGAYTYYDYCGGDYLPFIVAGKDSWSDPDWGDEMAVHEFNHALQFATRGAPEFWFWESTATWMEEYPYPSNNGWADYIVGYTYYPYIAISTSSQSNQVDFYHMYGMSIFNFYIDEFLGGPEAVRDIWQHTRGSALGANAEDLLDTIDADWDEAYQDFAVRNTVMAYREGGRMGTVAVEDKIRELPFEGAPSRTTRPGGYGQNYWEFARTVLGGTLEVQFDGDDVAWLVALVEYDGSEQVGLAIGEIDDGVGSVALETSGDNSVYMVVSPLKHTENTYDYEFTATLEASESTGDDDDDDDDDDTETDDTDTVTDDDGEPGVDATANEDGTITLNASGCACGTTGAGGGGGLVAAGAVLASAFSRRRPS